MSRQSICLSVMVLLLVLCANAWGTTPFSILPTFDVELGNDAQIGPGSSSETGSGMGMRNIASRRRVSFVTYDISTVRGPGQVFLNVSFSNYGHDPGAVNVYGVLESVEHLVAPGITWNTAPGVKNDPTPALDTDVVLDFADLTDILLTFNAPARTVRASTETSQALADFLSSDTNGFVAFMFAPEGSGNAIVRTVEMGADGGTILQGEVGGQPVAARDPNPEDQSNDIYKNVTLSWTPGTYTAVENVYLGTSFADVNVADADNPLGVLASLEQDGSTYEPAGVLEYGQTYFWRVDGVNSVDGTIYRGPVWSFTVEPVVYTMQNIVATASSSETQSAPENTVNGSGLNEDLRHGTVESTMWLSAKVGPQPSWIQYEFDQVYRLQGMRIWNYNSLFEGILGMGIKDATIEYSLNGTDWTILSEAQLARATGLPDYSPDATIDLGGLAAQYVRVNAQSNWGGIVAQYGLSEVQFLYTPTYAGNPDPGSAQEGVTPNALLQWRPGREAVSHQVHFGMDEQAVASSTTPVATASQSSFDPGPLQLATTYFWRVDEINGAMSPSLWQGPVWSFTTAEFIAVDDFEAYTDDEGSRIYETWVDGWEVPANGSQVGYAQAPFAERSTIHGGRQSMPLAFDNTSATYSEAERTFDAAQDWTAHGVKTLALHFYGPAENTVGQLYLKINGTKVAYAGPADDLKKAEWAQWSVDLPSLGINLKSVRTLTVGIEGTGATGTLFIDDVQLLP